MNDEPCVYVRWKLIRTDDEARAYVEALAAEGPGWQVVYRPDPWAELAVLALAVVVFAGLAWHRRRLRRRLGL